MFFLKAAFCRIFQAGFRVAQPFLPYRDPEIIHSCAQLGNVLREKGLLNALIVTDPGIVRSGLVAPLEKALVDSGVAFSVYDRTQPNPTARNVDEAMAIYRENGCQCLIAIGGGSSIDCAKALGALIAYPGKTLNQLKGALRVHRRLPPLIAIPTTAGTGSESTLAAIITDTENHYKYALMSFPLIPHYAVLDPSLTCSLPPHLTATTGVDALTHAVEAYIGRSTTQETRQLALDAVRLVFKNVEAAFSDGQNLYARLNMLHAANKAGVAFSKSYIGYVHAIAHSLGGQYGTPHGLANAVILPYVLDAYGECIHEKLCQLGIAAGVVSESDVPDEGAKKFIQAVRSLNTRMSIPEKLPGIRKEDIPSMSRRAEREANPLYPVPKLMTRKELEIFYYQIADWSSEQ